MNLFDFINLYKKIFINKINKNFKNFFCTSMIPYPSGSLHIGHVRNYLINDIFNRFLKTNNYNIYNYIGWDSFGTPAENASIKHFISPNKWVNKNISYMKKQFKYLGFFYKWKTKLIMSNYDYYKWSQKIFINLCKKNFIYIKNSYVNWDPIDKTILSNEQVINGKGWRSGANIKYIRKPTYFVNLVKYKFELYNEIKNLNWPINVKFMQKNWLGNLNYLIIKFYFIIFKNLYIIHFYLYNINYNFIYISIIFIYINNNFFIKILKIYNNYFNYYKKLKLKNIYFNSSLNFKNWINNKINELWLINKKKLGFNKFFIKNLLNKKIYNLDLIYFDFKLFYKFKYFNFYKYYNYWKIKNWSISRQRYWGTPIPINKCFFCKKVFINNNLILLPKFLKSSFKKNSLITNKLFLISFCLKCNNKSYKETDTLDTFFDSSWYFLNYIKFNNKRISEINNWLPVNFYIGGVEHAILHLLYSRFIIKFLRDIKLINFGEPFTNLFTQGMILNKTFYTKKDNIINWVNILEIKNNINIYEGKIEKMSKSKNNGIDPNKLIKFYGIDSLKLSIIYNSYLDKDFIWNDVYVKYSFDNLLKFLKFFKKISIEVFYKINLISYNDKLFLYYIYKNFEKINLFYINLKYNKIISLFFVVLNNINKYSFNNNFIFNEVISVILRFIYPIIPHLTYKLWNKLNYNTKLGKIIYTFWPNIYKIKLYFIKKYIIFLNNKKIDILKIKFECFLINQIFNYLIFKKNFFVKKKLIKFIFSKNIINIIFN